jgi:membrane-associated phospholipid phosphatase
MTERREPFLAWPGWGLLGYALALGTAQSLWWGLVYHGADALTRLHDHRVRVHLDLELAIPLVPALILAYLSINLVFLPAPFILRNRQELLALTVSLAAVTGIAGIGFVLLPAEPAYPPNPDAGPWAQLLEMNHAIVLQHNLVPSLHVAMSCLTLGAYAMRCGPLGKSFLGAWAGLIALATLLTHEHHLLDVAAGLALAWVGRRFIYERWLEPLSTARRPAASRSSDPGPPA